MSRFVQSAFGVNRKSRRLVVKPVYKVDLSLLSVDLR